MDEQTLVLIKPDGLKKSLTGNILTRLSETKLDIIGARIVQVSRELAECHYAIHKAKPFYEGLINYITSGPVVVMVLKGNNVIQRVRTMVGATDPNKAYPGTIRSDYAQEIGRNIVHASDALETAEKEISIWFSPEEIVDYTMNDARWLFE